MGTWYKLKWVWLSVNGHTSFLVLYYTKGVYREEGMQLTMYCTYSSDFVSETGLLKIESSIRT